MGLRKGHCKYCLKSTEFVKSHIIPSSFYEGKSFKETAPKKQLSILSSSPEMNPKRVPTGIYDYFLCASCEKKFEIYDDYGFKLLSEKLHERKSIKHEEFTLEYYESYDYKKLKLFFMSVLLRGDLSDHFFFQHISIGPYAEKIKTAIDTRIEPDPGDFATFLTFPVERKPAPVIIPPAPKRFSGIRFYCIPLGRLFFYIKVDKRKVPSELNKLIMRPSRPLYLINFRMQSSEMWEVLREVVNNPANDRYFDL